MPSRCAEGGAEEVLKHLKTLKEVLKKPFPRKEEIERHVPPGSELKSLFTGMLDEIGEIPEEETSRKVLIRMASGPKYEAYRERADRVLERLKFVKEYLERTRAGSEGLKVHMVRE